MRRKRAAIEHDPAKESADGLRLQHTDERKPLAKVFPKATLERIGNMAVEPT
jgi:hypothetical protein